MQQYQRFFTSYNHLLCEKTHCLHYPQCNVTIDSVVGDLAVLC